MRPASIISRRAASALSLLLVSIVVACGKAGAPDAYGSFEATEVVIGGNVARAFDLFGPALVDHLGGSVTVRCTTLFETATLIRFARVSARLPEVIQ